MENYKLILFLCNWGPHGAFQTLQEDDYRIPREIRMIRIPCTGRISKALLFKAFEMGADGVAVAGCAPGTCRYGSGTYNAVKNTEDTREIIELLGLGRDRLRLATFLPDDVDRLSTFLADFLKDVKRYISEFKTENENNDRSITDITITVSNLVKRVNELEKQEVEDADKG